MAGKSTPSPGQDPQSGTNKGNWGNVLAALLARTSASQREVAEHAELDPSQLSKYISTKVQPNKETIWRLGSALEALGVADARALLLLGELPPEEKRQPSAVFVDLGHLLAGYDEGHVPSAEAISNVADLQGAPVTKIAFVTSGASEQVSALEVDLRRAGFQFRPIPGDEAFPLGRTLLANLMESMTKAAETFVFIGFGDDAYPVVDSLRSAGKEIVIAYAPRTRPKLLWDCAARAFPIAPRAAQDILTEESLSGEQQHLVHHMVFDAPAEGYWTHPHLRHQLTHCSHPLAVADDTKADNLINECRNRSIVVRQIRSGPKGTVRLIELNINHPGVRRYLKELDEGDRGLD